MMENEIRTENPTEDKSTDIIEMLTNFISYLKTGDECKDLLEPTKTELQDEIAFQQRAEKISKHYRQRDQIINEEKMMNELKQNINAITSDFHSEINKDKLTPNDISQINDKLMTLKILDIRDSRNIKSLKDFINSNKINLKDITKVEKEIKERLDKLTPKKILKKSKLKVPCTTKDHGSTISFADTYRRSDANSRVRPKTRADRMRHFNNIHNEDIILDSQTFNELLRLRLDNDQTRAENFSNLSIIDQNTRYRNNEDLVSQDMILSRIDEDSVEYSSLNTFNSAMNEAPKDNEDNISDGDIHIILGPLDDWINT